MIWSKECNAGRVHHCGEADDDGNFSLCMFTRESTESDRDWPWCCSSSGIHGSKDKMESPLSSDPFTTRHQSVQFRLDTMIFFMALLIGSTAGSFAFCAQSVSRRHGRCSMHEEFEMLRWYTVRLHERKLASERYGGPKLCHGNQGTLSISRSPPTSAIALSGFLCQQQAIAQGERLNGGVETPGGRLATGEPRIHGPAEMEVETNHSRLGQSSSDSPRVVNGISMHDAGQSMRTKAGGYPHTLASRTKISAANKGKTPWNKGRARSSEERARISYGVLQRNRRRLEEKCVELGMTVEMYEQKKKEEERASSANIKARKTANGGYRPTEATKQKISQILKAKWANGEISMTEKRKRYLFRVGNKEQVRNRLGKAHSEETKEKIRKSLRAKWNEDLGYQVSMRAKAFAQASSRDFRQRISNTLKRKWQDPHFRSTMMEKIRARKSLAGSSTCEEHKRKISAAMRQKWLDPIYRQKALAGMAKRREEMGMVSSQLRRPTRMHTVGRSSEDFHKSSARLIQPRQNRKRKSKIASSPRPTLANSPVKDRVRNRTKSSCSCGKEDKLMGSATTVYTIDPEEARRLRMREQRRDLYDLLYGNEASRINNADGAAKIIENSNVVEKDDFDLDNYDPYGLDELEHSRS